MHTISMLRRALGLSSDNQVRNRIERIKSLLSAHIRRGPNNQIFLTDEGLDLLKQLQELYDSGLTLAEASHVIQSKAYKYGQTEDEVSSGLTRNETKPNDAAGALIATVRDEMAAVRATLEALQNKLQSDSPQANAVDDPSPWWIHLREDVDVS